MRHITSLSDAALIRPSVVTIGSFDGVHRGHQHLIRQLLDDSRARDAVPVVLTFYPHPEMVLRGFVPGYYLTLPAEKARRLGLLGVELVVTHPFNETVRHMRAADFVDSLLTHLNMIELWVGPDFALGYRREGTVDFLRHQGEEKGFALRVVDFFVDHAGERVSSSSIRTLLAAGEMREVARLMGHPHRLIGQVVEGASRGRTIGFPTANLQVSPELAVPPIGVYAAYAVLDAERHPAVVNIGVRPTFDGTPTPIIEAHLLDFSGELYGHTLALDMIERLRDEHKFAGVEALIAQINADIERARVIFEALENQQG
ncbi:MAG: bifunctional riboflavin kinase/FAD synthetase [Anaerolineae bacterium]